MTPCQMGTRSQVAGAWRGSMYRSAPVTASFFSTYPACRKVSIRFWLQPVAPASSQSVVARSLMCRSNSTCPPNRQAEQRLGR